MERIKSKDNAKIKAACAAKFAKDDLFLVEGFHLVEMAVASHAAETIFSLEPYPGDCPNYLVSEDVLKKLASSVTPEGIVMLFVTR